MDQTSRHHLPYIKPAQAQKHVTHNEALRILDIVVQLSVLDQGVTTPPTSPNPGDTYLIGSDADGAWALHADEIASWQDGVWQVLSPSPGWQCYNIATQTLLVWTGAIWKPVFDLENAAGSVDTANKFGVNTTADTTNRLAVKSDSILLSHDDISPGSGDMKLYVNKSAESDVGALLFQNDYTSHAEIGLIGDNQFRLRVASDGSDWRNALVIDGQTGHVDMPLTAPMQTPVNLFSDAGRFSGSPEPKSQLVSLFVAPPYLLPYNGSVLSEGPKYTFNSSTFGGTRTALDPYVDALIQTIKQPGNAQRFGVEFFTLNVKMGTGVAAGKITLENEDHYRCLQNISAPTPSNFSLNYYLKVTSGSVLITQSTHETLFLDSQIVTGNMRFSPNENWVQITRHYDFKLDNYGGYSQILFGLMASHDAEFLIAAPSLCPGHITMAEAISHGIIAGMNAW